MGHLGSIGEGGGRAEPSKVGWNLGRKSCSVDLPGLGGGNLRKDVELQFASSVAEAEGTLSVEVGTFRSSLFCCFFPS